MTVLSTARSSPGLAKPELRQPLNPPQPPHSGPVAHAFATRVRSSISIRFEAHALPPRVYTSRSKECANVLRASSTRSSKKNTPLRSFPRIFLVQDPRNYRSLNSGRERGGKKLVFEKRFPSFSHVEIRSSVSEYPLSPRLDSRIGARFHAMRIVERHRIRKVVGVWSARGEKRNGLKRMAGGREADPRGCIPAERRTGVCSLSLSFPLPPPSPSLSRARSSDEIISSPRTRVLHAYTRTRARVHACMHTRTAAILLLSGPRRTARGIRASKAWRSEKCWKLDIQSVRGTAIPVEILLSSRVAPLCIRSRVARLDKSTDKTIIRNRSFYHRRFPRTPPRIIFTIQPP